MIMSFLSFLLLMWYITLIDLRMLNHPCDPGMNAHVLIEVPSIEIPL